MHTQTPTQNTNLKKKRKSANLKIQNHGATFLTMVSFGFSTANPPGGRRGAPVTN